MNDLNGKYIITLNVDGRDWTSRPIVSSLDQAIKEAKEQLLQQRKSQLTKERKKVVS